ncbi:hypothetical protein D4L85_30135 [Chryseolinea soli]|uniref:Uncharacterized protein n=1 Tax=Chryseolinea soli TaxID=2321403 RepID=A0A385SS07_9BACT|nr:hypothetical protein D4L85_30135 [Chryseolinea soli]
MSSPSIKVVDTCFYRIILGAQISGVTGLEKITENNDFKSEAFSNILKRSGAPSIRLKQYEF